MGELLDHVIVLAAGRGLRAGGPKALHGVGGRSWWQIQQERLAHVGLPVVWVVSERVRAGMGAAAPEQTVLADEMAPMFASVLVGADHVARKGGARGVFVLPVDVPASSADVFTDVARCADAAIPVHAGQHGHPLYLSWTLVRERILGASPEGRLDRLIADVRTEVEVGDPSVAINLNTPEDFLRWERSP